MTDPVFVPKSDRDSFDADDAMRIHDYIGKDDAEHTSFVLGELDGFHGTFFNHESEKLYYVVSGSAVFTVDGEEYELAGGDTLLIPPETKHAMRGTAEFVIVTSPPYDPETEEVLDDD